MACQYLVQVNVPFCPGIPNGQVLHTVSPGDPKTLKTLVIMQHQPIILHHSMIHSMIPNPGFEQGVCTRIVSHAQDIQGFGRSTGGYGH